MKDTPLTKDECVELGYIARAHGLRGELKVVLDVHDVNEYLSATYFYLSKKNAPLERWGVNFLRSGTAKMPILSLAGIQTREAAEELIGSTIYYPLALLPELEEGHFYYFQIVGFQVIDENLGKLGTIKTYAEAGTQDILIMHYQGKEVLIPVADEVVLKADLQQKLINTRLPEGLLEVYMGEDH
ncbi:MAG: ribosome maturation factor RimM [Bacteroidota bacterium]